MTGARIIGLGHPLAGDDAVGLSVVAHLRARRLDGIDLGEAADATELIALVADARHVVVVDGMTGAPPGQVRLVALEELDDTIAFRGSSHGLGVCQAIAIARALTAGAAPGAAVQLVGIGIALATPGSSQLSPAVRAAIPTAAALAVTLARAITSPAG